MTNTIIKVENLGKKYSIGEKQAYYSLRDTIGNMFSGKKKEEEFWALKDLNFEIKQGESVGIIGRNGAGKSTLLKILSRITPPTTGKITLHGRVASLLEVGTGFNPELTGRENIYLNGAILGMSRAEIKRKFDEIVAFSEVEKFLDMPVKHYSSGMYMRLAFAVAAHLESEILIVDEVLAVGDAQFQKKCLGKMDEVSKKGGRTVLFVSHNMATISFLCSKVIVLDKGSVLTVGKTAECLDKYIESFESRSGLFKDHVVVEDSTVEIIDAKINGTDKDKINILSLDEPIILEIVFFAKSKCRLTLETHLKDSQTNNLAVCVPGHIDGDKNIYTIEPGRHKLLAEIILPKLNKGVYFLEPRITEPGIRGYITFPNAIELHVNGFMTKTGLVFEQSFSGAGFQVMDGSINVY